jgi:adenylate cyclase
MEQMLSKPVRLFFLHISISIFVAVFVLLLTQNILFEFPPLKSAELSLIDLRFQQRGVNHKLKNSSKVVVVDINGESFKSLPAKWPWPQSYYTRLVNNLNRAGAKVIGIDILLSPGYDTDRIEDDQFRKEIKESGNIVLAGRLKSEKFQFTIHEQNPGYYNRFIDTTTGFGIANIPQDMDAGCRRYMSLYYDDNQEKFIPSFSMAVLNAYYNLDRSYTSSVSDDHFYYYTKAIPQYDRRSFLINYYGPDSTFRIINITDILDDSDFKTAEELEYNSDINTFDNPDYGIMHDSILNGKIVLVGSRVPEDKDLFLSPLVNDKQGNKMMYGVEMHANVIQSVIDGNFITREPFWMTACIVFGLTLFTFVFTERLKAIRTKFSALIEVFGVAIILAEIYIIYWISLKLFIDKNILADMMSPFLAIIISYIGSTVYNYVAERKQKIMIKSMFSRYVNPTIVDELVAHPEKLRLGGERKELTIFFSDIENFTQISEKMAPESLVTILNEYLNSMTAIILHNDGTLDKYEGDAIVAFWGAPVPQNDHALRACKAAVQMQSTLNGLLKIWQLEGKPILNTRIGINTGEVIVGNMGGANRFDYTVIGDSVNLGARLESANKQYKTRLMISESTYRKVQNHVYVRELDLLVVAGKTEPIRVYELIGTVEDGIASDKQKFIEVYCNALQLYRQREWDRAVQMFGKSLELIPNDYPSQIYIERSHIFKASPPPDEWNGVFILKTK